MCLSFCWNDQNDPAKDIKYTRQTLWYILNFNTSQQRVVKRILKKKGFKVQQKGLVDRFIYQISQGTASKRFNKIYLFMAFKDFTNCEAYSHVTLRGKGKDLQKLSFIK